MIEKIVVERILSKRLDVEQVRSQLKDCAATALKSNRGHGWTFSSPHIKEPEQMRDGNWLYRQAITFKTTSNRASLDEKWPAIVHRFAEAGCAGSLKNSPWKVVDPPGFEGVAAEAVVEAVKAKTRKAQSEEDKSLGDVNLTPTNEFDRIYGRQPQINRIMDALGLAKRTDWLKRHHSLLDGLPGSGKSEIMKAFSKMLGEENQAYLWFDATSMTKAGAIEEIIESEYVPPVLFIEEIEKCEELALRWLLGIMDVRGEIRRTNYRVGNQAKNVRMVVIATANDVRLLQGVMSGALYSRFQNNIYCPSPDRVIMQQILEREVKEINGERKWIEPALQFGFDKWGITDPRSIITICTCGADRLLTGDYQKDYEATMHPAEKERLEKEKGKQNGG